MPQLSSPLTINDGVSTPVTFSVEKLSTETSVFVDRRMATREAQPSLVVTFDRATPARKTFKVSHSLALPIVRTVGGMEAVSDVARAKVEYILPQSMNTDERKNIRALIANAQIDLILAAGIEDLDPMY